MIPILSMIRTLRKGAKQGKRVLRKARSLTQQATEFVSSSPALTSSHRQKLTVADQILNQAIAETESHFQSYEQTLKLLEEKGGKEGTKGIPTLDEDLGFTEQEIIRQREEALTGLEHSYRLTQLELEEARDKAKTALATPIEKATILKQLAVAKRQKLEQAALYQPPQLTVEAKAVMLEEEVAQMQDSLDSYNLEEQDLLKAYGEIPPSKEWYHYRLPFIVTLFGLFGMEISVNFFAFMEQGVGDNNAISLLLGFFFAFVQGFSAERLGAAWQQNKKQPDFTVSLLFTVVACVLMSSFRLNMDVGLLAKVTYLLINFIIAAMAAFVTRLHYQHTRYFKVVAERNRLSLAIVATTQQIVILREAYQQRCVAIEADFEQKAEDLLAEEIKGWEQLQQGAEDALQRWEKHYHTYQDKIKDANKEALQRYRDANQQARKKYRHPLIDRWKVKSTLNATMNGTMGLLLVGLMGLSLTGCEEITPVPTTIEVILDQTDGLVVPIDHARLADYLYQLALPEEDVTGWGDVTVNVSEIGETSNIPVLTVLLPASKSFWQRQELDHKVAKQQFRTDILTVLDSINQPSEPTRYSYIHRNFYYRLEKLSKQPGRRIVISFSDLLLNSPVVDFYDYRNEPDNLLKQQDKLLSTITSGYPLPDLRGIALLNIYHTDNRLDHLHETAKRLFGDYWRSHGLTVAFESTLALPLHTVFNEISSAAL